MQLKGVFVLAFTMVACAPPGTPMRTTHTPFLIKKSPLSLDSAASPLAMAKGLPFQCQISLMKKGLSCIQCNSQPAVLRCLKSRRALDGDKHCYHDSTKLKCLVGERGLYVNLHRPQEKTFRLQLELLVENIEVIASNKIRNEEDRQLLQSLLGALADKAEDIAGLTLDTIPQISEDIAQPLSIDTAPFVKSLQKLYKKRLQGRMDSDSSRKMLLDMIAPLPQLQPLTKILEEISVQGIDANLIDG